MKTGRLNQTVWYLTSEPFNNQRPVMAQFTSSQRQNLQLLLSQVYSQGAIAKVIGKHSCSIGREITRNGFNRCTYTALQAQAITKQRRFAAATRPKRGDAKLMAYVDAQSLQE